LNECGFESLSHRFHFGWLSLSKPAISE
jgi:hypothetical protein